MREDGSRAIALTIAGSDSGGGAGIQADLKTFHRFGVFGTSVVTAVTAQNTTGVTAVHGIPLEVIDAQFEAIASDLLPSAAKSGMLASAEVVYRVAHASERMKYPLVVDPVMVATSGDRLLDDGAERAIIDVLLPRAALVTPNIPEAERLIGRSIDTPDEMAAAGRRLVELGARAALVKGGHLEGELVDVLIDGGQERRWSRQRIETRHTHGTGCTLSAAITARLALGDELEDAVSRGLDFVHHAIATAPGLGSGHGPLNHFAGHDPLD